MKPSRTRFHVWPFVAIPAAGLIALVATTAGLARDRPLGSSIQKVAELTRALPNEQRSPKEADSGKGMQKSPIDEQKSDRQISYEVRFLSLDAEPWRDLLKDRLKLVKQEADVCAWIIDEKALTDLLKLAQAATTSNVLQAPKVTAFENSAARIFRGEKQHFVAQVEKVGDSQTAAFRPIVTAIEVGVRMELSGAIQAHATRLSADLQDTQLLAMHKLHRKDLVGDKLFASQYEIPTRINRQCRLTCDIPETSSLLISLGLHERPAGRRMPSRPRAGC